MFEIDLRRSYLEQQQNAAGGDDATEVALAFVPVAAGLAVIGLLLWFWGSRLDSRIGELERDIVKVEAETEAKRQELLGLTGQARTVIAEVEQIDVYWSDILRLLSERAPDKLWLSQAASSSSSGGEGQPMRRTLRLEGGVLSASTEGNLTEIGEFIGDLQLDSRYARYFADAQLGAIRRGNEELALTFTLTAPLRPRPLPELAPTAEAGAPPSAS